MDTAARGIITHYDILTALGTDAWYVTGADTISPRFTRIRLNPENPRNTLALRDVTWEQATNGHTMVWVNLPNQGGLWWPQALTDRLTALTIRDTGKPVKVSATTTTSPCPAYVGVRDWGNGGHTCARPVKDGGTHCGLHAAVKARRDAAEAERQARLDAQAEARDRKAETRRAAQETLDRLADDLEALGITPRVVTVADDGSIRLPAEVLETLVQFATEGQELLR